MTSQNGIHEHLNTGMLELRVSRDDHDRGDGLMTVVVTGVGRSGTSMVAKLLDALGIWMGNTEGLAVFEDQEFNRALYQMDYNRVRQLINAYDNAHQRWGLKFASLQNHIFPPHLDYFRRPHLIVVMRDIAATASRSHISDGQNRDSQAALRNVAKQTSDMVNFICESTCPTLVVSYEKFIMFPDKGIDAVAAFCGITMSDDMRRNARQAIEPNNPQYIKLFHPSYRGNFDSVKYGAVLGWCAADDSFDPVDVELVADGTVLAVTKADLYRTDLFAAGIGNGYHGFRFDLSGLVLNDAMVLQVRTVDGGHIVHRSGRRLGDFPDRYAPKEGVR
jgi:hypothetical protein